MGVCERPVVNTLRSAADPVAMIRTLLMIREDLTPEIPSLLDMLVEDPERGCGADARCAAIALAQSLGGQIPPWRLDALDRHDSQRLRLLSAVARWNSGDRIVPPLLLRDIIARQKEIAEAKTKELAGERGEHSEFFVQDCRRRFGTLDMGACPWGVEVPDEPDAALDFLVPLAGLVGDGVLVSRLAGDLSANAGFLHAILDRIDGFVGTGAEKGFLLLLLTRTGGSCPRAIDRLERMAEGDARRQAVQTLGNMTAERPRVTRILLDILRSRKGEIQAAAIRSLAKVGRDCPEVRSGVLACLAKAATADALEAATAAARAFGIPASEIDSASMCKHLGSRYPHVQNRAALACGGLGIDGPPVREALRRLLGHQMRFVAGAAAVALWRLEGNRTDTLEPLLRGVQTGCHKNRGSLNAPGSLKALEDMRHAGPEVTELGCLKALEEMGHAGPEVTERLALIVEKDALRWFAAAKTMLAIGAGREEGAAIRSRCVKGLIKRLEAGYPKAAEMLGDLGAEGGPALPLLQSLSESGPRVSRVLAKKALVKIRESTGQAC
jgi:hypothetical protein